SPRRPTWLSSSTAEPDRLRAVVCVETYLHRRPCVDTHDRTASGGRPAIADAHRLDAVLAHGLDADRIAVGGDGVAPPRKAPERGEHEPADRVVGVRVDR